MAGEIDVSLLEAHSRGEVTRREIAERIGREVRFGELLGQLHAHGLKLPRVASDPRSPGVELIRRLAERGQRAG